jgi:hypothetical protein
MSQKTLTSSAPSIFPPSYDTRKASCAWLRSYPTLGVRAQAGTLEPEDVLATVAISGTLAINIGSWNRLSGVRFSCTTMTMYMSFPCPRRAGVVGVPHALRVASRAVAETSRTKRQTNALRVMQGGEDVKMQNPLERIGSKAD